MDQNENKANFTFVWKLKNFTFLDLMVDKELESPVFKADIFEGVEWRLIFCPQKCYLQRVETDKGSEETTISFRFEIICTDGCNLASKKEMRKFMKGECHYWTYFLKHNEILEQRTKFLPDDCLTIYFHMWEHSLKTSSFTRCIAYTEHEIEKCSFVWSLKKFSSCVAQCKSFSFPGEYSYEVTLNSSDNDYINITIKCKDANQKAHLIRGEISLLDSMGIRHDSKQHGYLFTFSSETWKFPLFLKKRQLLGEKLEFLPNDILSLSCKFAISTGLKRHKIEEYQYGEIIGDWPVANVGLLDVLPEGFLHMYTGRKMTDVAFKVQDKTLPAHKFVLAARSPVFSAMFEQEMSENKSGIIEIQDIDYDILDELLIFMYGGALPNMKYESAIELMIAADKYQVLALKEQCSSFLKSNLTDETVCEILTVSDMVQDKHLKAFAIKYFMLHVKTVMNSSKWKQLLENNCKLANEALCKFALDKSFA